MKYQSTLNLFWTIVWAAVLVCAIVAIFWLAAVYVIIVLAAVMFGTFLRDYVRIVRMK